ncbi:MAG TPA: hypothetical protein VKQ30_26360 [Ktedonobacterales bacterium]|nr:hypothetical protein [Ktedonobacterales bacterium]
MTAGCAGNGPTQANPVFGRAIQISSASLAIKFANSANWASLAIGAAIAYVYYDLTTFCPNGPPAIPVFDAFDIAALLNPYYNTGQAAASQKLQDWLAAMLFWDLCECVTGASPAPPTPALPPADMPTVNPPQVVPPATSTPCAQSDSPAPQYPTSVGHVWTLPFNYGSFTSVVLHIKNFKGVVGPFPDTVWEIVMAPVSGTAPLFDQTSTFPSGTGADPTFAIPPGTYSITVAVTGVPAGATQTVELAWELYCGGAPPPGGAGQQPCCTEDSVKAEISQILKAITLIQRQLVPFAYVPGTVHPGLTGAGSFAIQGILGVSVNVTSVPGPIGQEGTTPAEYFDLGFITFGTADGYPHSVRLEHNPQLILPARCSAFTQLAYDLAPGAVVTINELLREP